MGVIGCYFDCVFVSYEGDFGCPCVSGNDCCDEDVAFVVGRV